MPLPAMSKKIANRKTKESFQTFTFFKDDENFQMVHAETLSSQ